jgi:hypothetical protein
LISSFEKVISATAKRFIVPGQSFQKEQGISGSAKGYWSVPILADGKNVPPMTDFINCYGE